MLNYQRVTPNFPELFMVKYPFWICVALCITSRPKCRSLGTTRGLSSNSFGLERAKANMRKRCKHIIHDVMIFTIFMMNCDSMFIHNI